jgi:serine/threonine protein kinase
MVMNLLGENLSELRKSRGKFSLATTLKIGIKLIPILEAVHSMGHVHRDIKPVRC